MGDPVVLVVAADAACRDGLVSALAQRGFDARVQGDAERADCVLVAEPRPVAALRQLRSRSPLARFVVWGEAHDWGTAVELAALGAMDVIPRSTAPDELARRLRKLVSREAA